MIDWFGMGWFGMRVANDAVWMFDRCTRSWTSSSWPVKSRRPTSAWFSSDSRTLTSWSNVAASKASEPASQRFSRIKLDVTTTTTTSGKNHDLIERYNVLVVDDDGDTVVIVSMIMEDSSESRVVVPRMTAAIAIVAVAE